MRKLLEEIIGKTFLRLLHGVLLFFLLISIIGLHLIPNLNLIFPNILFLSLYGLSSFLFLFWIFWTGWHNMCYRYILWKAAKLYSGIAIFIKNHFGDVILIITIIFLILLLFFNYLPDFLIRIPLGEILVFFIIVGIVRLSIKSRKHVKMIQFINLTGDEKFKSPVEGIHVRLINRVTELGNLVRTVDLINPKSKNRKIICLPFKMENAGDILNDLVPPDQKIKFASFLEIPVGFLMTILSRIMIGPILSGSLHKNGKRLELVAHVSGGKINKSWCITGDMDNSKSEFSGTQRLEGIIDQLAYQIFSELGPVRSKFWKAVYHYTLGLKAYREGLYKNNERNIYLRRAEKEFINALKEDSSFVQCHYHLGVVYEELEEWESAESAYREALKWDPGDADSHFLLGCYNCEKEKYEDALFYCNEALRIQPTDARFWNLKGVLYDRMYKKFNKNQSKNDRGKHKKSDLPYQYENPLLYFYIAVKLSWQEFCKSTILNEDNKRINKIARVCMNNLALMCRDTKIKRKVCLFYQSGLASSGEGKPFWDLGMFYCRNEKWRKAISAFLRVFENDPSSADSIIFWSIYLYACGNLLNKNEYQTKLTHSKIHLLDAISERLWDHMIDITREPKKEKKYQDNEIFKIFNRNYLSIDDYSFLEENIEKLLEGKNNSLVNNLGIIISKLIKKSLKNEIEDRMFIQKVLDEIGVWVDFLSLSKKSRGKSNRKELQKEEKKWVEAQLLVLFARKILEDIENNGRKDFSNEMMEKVIKGLYHAKEILDNKSFDRELSILDLNRLLAQCYILKKDYREALFFAQKAIDFNPQSADNRATLSRIYFILNNYELALIELEKCMSLKPGKPEILQYIPILNKWGFFFSTNEERRKTFETIAQLLYKGLEHMTALDPIENKDDREKYFVELYRIYYNLGIYNRELKDYDKAYGSFKTAASFGKRKDKFNAKIELGRTYLEARDYNNAEIVFRELFNTLTENRPDGNTNLKIEVYLGLSASIIERTIACDKSNDTFKYIHDQILKEIENLISAGLERKKSQDDKEILKVQGDYRWYSALYHECFGRMYFKQGNTEQAIIHLENSVSSLGSPRVYYFLANAYWMYAQEKKKSRYYFYLEKVREACSQSRNFDKNERFSNELAELEKKITAAMDRLHSE